MSVTDTIRKSEYAVTVSRFMVDYRLGNLPRYCFTSRNDSLMQLPPEIQKCVAFACFNGKGGIQLAGTAFFVGVQTQEIGASWVYIVTAKHVIAGILKNSIDEKVLLRVNMKNGPSKFVETHSSDWKYHPGDSSVDVAVLDLALAVDLVDYLTIPIEIAATQRVVQEQAIGVGDDVFLTGLFVNHFGRARNLPIIRVGNIALMPEEPVDTRDLGPIAAYLVEARSIGGLSGSPVFVQLGNTRIRGNIVSMGGPNRFYWLGLMHGHFDLKVKGDDTLIEDALSDERVNMGIAIVVPVDKILEVINQEVFVEMREKVTKERQQKVLPMPDLSH